MNGNDFVKFFLRTLLHIFMGNTMLITVTGRKSVRKYTTPVGFYCEGDTLWIISSRSRTWWRNVIDGAEVELHIRGRDMSGFAQAILDEAAVASQIINYVRHIPMSAKGLGVRLENGEPHPGDAARLASERMFVKIRLNQQLGLGEMRKIHS